MSSTGPSTTPYLSPATHVSHPEHDYGLAPHSPESTSRVATSSKSLEHASNSPIVTEAETNWEALCVRATDSQHHDLDIESIRLILAAFNRGGQIVKRETTAGAVLHQLRKRMMSNHWLVAIKAQLVIHFILREGKAKVFDHSHHLPWFQMDGFNDSSPEGIVHKPFIMSYGAYLEHLLRVRAIVRIPFSKPETLELYWKMVCSSVPSASLFPGLLIMIGTVEMLIAIRSESMIQSSSLRSPFLRMIFNDMSVFWKILPKGVVRLLDFVITADISTAVNMVDLYKRFVLLVEKAQPFLMIAKTLKASVDGTQVPELGRVSLEMTEPLEQYIDDRRKNNGGRKLQNNLTR